MLELSRIIMLLVLMLGAIFSYMKSEEHSKKPKRKPMRTVKLPRRKL